MIMLLHLFIRVGSNWASFFANVGTSGLSLSYRTMQDRAIRYRTLLIAACVALVSGSPAAAIDRDISLQGLFCNTLEHLEDTLAHVNKGLSPQSAAQLSNEREVVCSYVNSISYVVVRPTKIGMHHGRLSVMKYEGDLIGVIVGGVLRPVSPSLRTYFVIPEPLPEISVGQRL